MLKASQTKKKDKKDKKKAKAGIQDLPVDDLPEEVDVPPPSKQAIEVTAEDLADEEWGPVKEKKKDKKGKKKGKVAVDEEEEEVPKASESWLLDLRYHIHAIRRGDEGRGSRARTTSSCAKGSARKRGRGP